MEELERIYVVPLREAYEKPRIKRAKKAAQILRSFISRHMKVEESAVNISNSANSAIWESGIKKPPRKIRVVANRDKEGKVTVSIVGEKEELAKKEQKAANKAEKKKEKKPPAEKKEALAPKPAEKPSEKQAEKAHAQKKQAAKPPKNNEKEV